MSLVELLKIMGVGFITKGLFIYVLLIVALCFAMWYIDLTDKRHRTNHRIKMRREKILRDSDTNEDSAA